MAARVPHPAMSEGHPRMLVVDDDPALRELLCRYLSEQGFAVDAVADGDELDRFLVATRPDLVILDLMLPGEDGLSIARRLRAHGNLPIIMLSARGEDLDRIIGLEVGADDYLPKPFNPRELLARIRAVLRRHSTATEPSAEPTQAFVFGPFRVDMEAHTLRRDGVEVPLTTAEFTLLRAFAEHPNRVLSRDTLLERLKGYERSPFDRTIDVRVARLRKKIEPDPAAPVYIRTVRGEGYLFTPRGAAK
jgi:two-component system, OmpR family, phosphate regulon response regulator OmpR